MVFLRIRIKNFAKKIALIFIIRIWSLNERKNTKNPSTGSPYPKRRWHALPCQVKTFSIRLAERSTFERSVLMSLQQRMKTLTIRTLRKGNWWRRRTKPKRSLLVGLMTRTTAFNSNKFQSSNGKSRMKLEVHLESIYFYQQYGLLNKKLNFYSNNFHLT